jgi:hypothetical protein
MMTRRSALVWLAGGACLLLSRSAPVTAQSSSDLFDIQRIHDVRLTMHPRELALLRANWQLNTFYPATFQWGSVRVRDVAVRSRGLGSRNPTKLGLEVDFDRYVAGRRFVGLSSLVLDNLWQDKSMIREAMAVALFHRVGMPASRLSFARFFLNNEFQGLYALVEPIDTEFLGRAYQDPGGYLYEYKWLFDFRAGYLGDGLDAYKPVFEPRSHESESDEALYGPLRDLFRAVNQSDDGSWRSAVESHLNLQQLVRYVAIEAYVTENDGFLGYAGLNNHYWYRPANSGQHQVIVWDKDQAFLFLDSSIFRDVETNEILRRALAEPDLLTLFLDTLDECVNRASEDDWFANELERVVSLIQPVVEADTRKQFTTEEFFTDVEHLRAFAAQRPGDVRDQVNRSRSEAGALAPAFGGPEGPPSVLHRNRKPR